MEAVVEGVISCQCALPVLLVSGSHFSSAVIHLSHLVQPLPANDDRVHSTLMRSRERISGSLNSWKEEMLIEVDVLLLYLCLFDNRLIERTEILTTILINTRISLR